MRQEIRSKDILTGRKNFFGKFASKFVNVKSELKFKNRLINAGSSANDALIEEMYLLPPSIIVPRNCVTWVAQYRKYLGLKSIKNNILNKRLAEELSIRSMMKCYNLHSLQFIEYVVCKLNCLKVLIPMLIMMY